VFRTDQVADAIAQQEVAFFEFSLDARPFSGRDELTKRVDRLLSAKYALVHEMARFILDNI
jgi:hypothetical protein